MAKKSKKDKPSRTKYRSGNVKAKNKALKAERHERYLEKCISRRIKKAEKLGRKVCDVCQRILSKTGVCGRQMQGIHN